MSVGAWFLGRTALLILTLQESACGRSRPASSESGAASSRSSTERSQDQAPRLVHVEDLSGKLTSEDRSALIAKLERASIEAKVQLGVIIVPSLNGSTIEQLGERTFENWKLGERGILVVIVIHERQARIETGDRIEPIISDEQAHAVLVKHLNPHLRAEDFYGGLDETFGALLALLQLQEEPKIVP